MSNPILPTTSNTSPLPNPPERSGLWAKIKTAVTSGVEKFTNALEKRGVDAAVALSRKVESTGVFSDTAAQTVATARDVVMGTALVTKVVAREALKAVAKVPGIATSAFKSARRIAKDQRTAQFFNGAIGKATKSAAKNMAILQALENFVTPQVAKGIGKFLRTQGGELGRIVSTLTPMAAMAAVGAIVLRNTPNQESQVPTTSFERLRASRAMRGIAMSLGMLTIMAAQWQYANSMQERAENIGANYFEMFGQFMGSVAFSSLLLSCSSGVPFKECFQNNLQYAIADTACAVLSPQTGSISRGIFATVAGFYAVPMMNLVKTIHRIRNSERIDLAQRLKDYLMPIQENSLAAAIQAHAAAAQKGEDLREHDKTIANIENRSIVMNALFNSLDQIFRLGFTKFNAYQALLANSSNIAVAQIEFRNSFTPIFYQAVQFEKELQELDIERTSDYLEAVDQGRAPVNPESFVGERRKHYENQKKLAKENLQTILHNATTQNMTLFEQGVAAAVNRKIFPTFIAPQLANIPEIGELETTVLGFPITTPADAAIAKELIEIYAQSFLAFSAAPIVSVVASSLGGEATSTTLNWMISFVPQFVRPVRASSEPAAQTPLSRSEELQLIEGLLQPVLNHYKQANPNSTMVDISSAILSGAITTLSQGITPARTEWLERDIGWDMVDLENRSEL